ncbi:hypothetical protein [Bacillus sp. SJS]|uniref:hypothetical protein n=1 Tax=Bacillus sp. SJS TaxID=1423321 RepID=UPI0004DD048C|nr:hypothetical protein [Bacillus sp. SJS]KZZ84735.1 hypothetical protein AS29_009390 [Bacillus sp. SJS]
MIYKLSDTSIELPYSIESLKRLLNEVYDKENTYSHYEFVKWCDNLTMVFDEDDSYIDGNLKEFTENDLAFKIARDIECNWDLHLGEEYSVDELKKLNLAQVNLPEKWIRNWFKEINGL